MLFYDFVSKRTHNDQTFIDLGAGRGYLTAFLGIDLGHRIIAVEASKKHTVSLANRMIKIEKRYNKKYDGQQKFYNNIHFF